jgi:uncharacterized membrane protein
LEKKTSTGLQENAAALLCYVVWWITGIIFLLLEPDNKFIRFHAIQSIIVFGFITLVAMVFSFMPIIGGFIGWIVWAIGVALWVVLMVKAYQGTKFKLPVAGDLAEKWAEKSSSSTPPSPPQPPAPK